MKKICIFLAGASNVGSFLCLSVNNPLPLGCHHRVGEDGAEESRGSGGRAKARRRQEGAWQSEPRSGERGKREGAASMEAPPIHDYI